MAFARVFQLTDGNAARPEVTKEMPFAYTHPPRKARSNNRGGKAGKGKWVKLTDHYRRTAFREFSCPCPSFMLMARMIWLVVNKGGSPSIRQYCQPSLLAQTHLSTIINCNKMSEMWFCSVKIIGKTIWKMPFIGHVVRVVRVYNFSEPFSYFNEKFHCSDFSTILRNYLIRWKLLTIRME